MCAVVTCSVTNFPEAYIVENKLLKQQVFVLS